MSNIFGRLFAIEEFTVFDGPGIRTSVFLKGCPLRCSWCHNPEGRSPLPEVLKSPNGCLECGACRALALEKTGCERLIPQCAEVCPRGLIRVAGEEISVSDLTERVLKNKFFFENSGGGVTFSGGEPLMQADFLGACLKALSGKVHRCVQTSGHCASEIFRCIAEETDMFLFDIKIVDPKRMFRYTGGDSELIISNLKALTEMKKDVTVRLPLIPTVTDTEENISDIIKLLLGLGITYAEAMPYNTMAGAKYPLAGKEFKPEYDHSAKVRIPEKVFAENGIELKIL